MTVIGILLRIGDGDFEKKKQVDRSLFMPMISDYVFGCGMTN